MRATLSFILIVTCVLYHNNLLSQQDSRIPKVIPPSPNAAAIQRYGDIPVSAYTGIPNISIPLYQVQSGNITIPVSINYNASGIRVAEEASRVGLGWVLNAGGAISRIVVGDDDFGQPSFSYNNQTTFEIPKAPRFDQGYNFNVKEGCDVTLDGYGINYTIPSGILSSGTNYDLQPDQYSYSFNGHSGKFILRRNRDVVLNSIEKIDIKVIGSDATSWEVKTPDGTLYKFEQFESYVDYGGGGGAHKSSWYLTKIVSSTGRSVEFVYSTLSAYIHSVGSYFESNPGVNLPESYTGITAPSPYAYYAAAVSGKWYSNLYLSKIVSDQTEVQFNYIADRVDVENDIRLDNVKIYARKYGESNQLIKTWNFSYSYFIGTNYGPAFNPNASADNLSKRLKLLSVQELSGSVSLPPYQFFYNNEQDVSSSLPGKLSFARDHWGYYNGKTSNSSLIPSFVSGCHTDPVIFSIGAMGNERNPDPNYNQLFALNKIKYPTGGNTTFEYETHDFDVTTSSTNDHSYFANYIGYKPASVEAGGFPNISAGGTFTATLDLTDMVPCGQTVPLIANFAKVGGLSPGTGIMYSLKDPSGLEIGGGYVESFLGSTSPPMTEWLGPQSANNGFKMTLMKGLTPGIYTWSFYVPPGVGLIGSNVYISYSKAETAEPINNSGETVYNALFGGGLRIKRIIDRLDDGSSAKVRKYSYHYTANGKTYSYGKRMTRPNYAYFAEYIGVAGQNPITGLSIMATGNTLMRESDSNIPLNGSAGGSTVGYDKVEELIGENGEYGKTIYEYENQPDVVYNYSQYKQVLTQGVFIPRKPPFGSTVSNVGNGNLLKQTNYALWGGKYIPVSEQVNTYSDLILAADVAAVLGIERRSNGGENPFVPYNCYITSYVYPAMTTNRKVLLSTTSTAFDKKGIASPIVTTTAFTYDNTTHLQLTNKTDYKSNGDKLVTTIKYPADFTDQQCDAALLAMKGSAFMHALPVLKQTVLTKGTNQYLAEGSINKYQVINGKIFQKEIAQLESNQLVNISSITPYNPAVGYPSNYKARIFFDNYDASGNLLQIHKSDDISTSYLWAYYGNYPVAEVKNAASNEVFYDGFESENLWDVYATKDNTKAYTGSYSAVLNGTATVPWIISFPNSPLNVSLSAPTKFKYSGWVYSNGPQARIVLFMKTAGESSFSTYDLVETYETGKWVYLEKEFLVPANMTQIILRLDNLSYYSTGKVWFDDLRLHPSSAMMTTYTYDPLKGMTSQTDVNNKSNYYEYDSLGRLHIIRDQDGNIVKTIDYHYKGQ